MGHNIHLQHPEDSILTGDLSVLDWFTQPANVSVKIDGAPAIVWGNDPATHTFFVGTKAVFNKKKLRIAHNHDEIDLYYDGEVADILHACFDCLPRTDCIFQGDFIGFGGDDTYKPNTVKYVFPDLVMQSIIVAPHTMYDSYLDLRDAEALFNTVGIGDLKSTKDVLFVRPDAWQDDGDFDDIVRFARQMSTMVTFAKNKTHARKITSSINTVVKSNAALSLEKLTGVADCDVNLLRLWKLVKSMKDRRLALCATSGGPLAFIGNKFIGAEGYVLTNDFGSYKLVKREVFSRHNFNHGRFSAR
tara:strand:+ start:389 stop:1297 length:909 start_codon:yes stop_codon:yes gene_type:complete